MKYTKEQIKELILTDYLDGRLDEAQRREIDASIEHDAQLREFLQAVKGAAQRPFEGPDDVKPPEHVWLNIKESIEAWRPLEQRPVWDGLARRFKAVWEKPRLSFTLGSAMAILVFVVLAGTGRFRHLPVDYIGEQQVEYLMYLSGGEWNGSDDEPNGFGTSIENHFL